MRLSSIGCSRSSRAGATADPAVSHSARLLSRGTAKVAQKFGEEAVECLIEAVAGNRDALIAESADVLYHLIVLWVSSGVDPTEVWAELVRREGVSGIAEKAARASTLVVRRKWARPKSREPSAGFRRLATDSAAAEYCRTPVGFRARR